MEKFLVIANQLNYDFDGDIKTEVIELEAGTDDELLDDISDSVSEYEQRQFTGIAITEKQAKQLIEKLKEFIE